MSNSSFFSSQFVVLTDSLSIIGYPIARMVQDLQDTAKKLLIPTKTMFPSVYAFLESLGLNQQSQELIASTKLSFPFEKIKSFSYLKECTVIPPIEDFSSLLRDTTTGITSEYENFGKVWRALNAKNMLDMFHVYIGRHTKKLTKNDKLKFLTQICE